MINNIKFFSTLTTLFLIIGTLIITTDGRFAYLYGQERNLSTKEMKLEIISIQKEIAAITKKKADEANYHKRFVKEKKIVIEQKKKERAALTRSINLLRSDVFKNKNKAKKIELYLARTEREDDILTTAIRQYASMLIERVNTGIPFQKTLRTSLLNSIIFDIDSNKASAVEGFNRVLKFLDDEETLAYDSETIQILQEINGSTTDVTMLRIGRVFFAIDTPEVSYLYIQKPDGTYFLNTKKPLNLFEKRNLKQAIMMVQGKKPPAMIVLPVNMQNVTLIKK